MVGVIHRGEQWSKPEKSAKKLPEKIVAPRLRRAEMVSWLVFLYGATCGAAHHRTPSSRSAVW